MKKIISSHNKKILSPREERLPCNCWKSKVCPFGRNGDCRKDCMVYQATVVPTDTQTPIETYIGMTEPPFKKRYFNHEKAFNRKEYMTDSELSKHIWRLKDKNISYDIIWKVIDRAPSFSPVSKVCSLCTLEKYYIMFRPDLASLNKHEEIFKPCIHRKFKLLENT